MSPEETEDPQSEEDSSSGHHRWCAPKACPIYQIDFEIFLRKSTKLTVGGNKRKVKETPQQESVHPLGTRNVFANFGANHPIFKIFQSVPKWLTE